MVSEKGRVYFETGPLDKDQQRETQKKDLLCKQPKETKRISMCLLQTAINGKKGMGLQGL